MARLAVLLVAVVLMVLVVGPAKQWAKANWEYFLWVSDLWKAPKYTNKSALDTTSPVLSAGQLTAKELCTENCAWQRTRSNEEYLNALPEEEEMRLEDTEMMYPLQDALSCQPTNFGYSREQGEGIFPHYGYPKCREIAPDSTQRLFLNTSTNLLYINCPANSTYRVVLGPTDTRRLVMRREVEDLWNVQLSPPSPLPTEPFHEFAFGSCSAGNSFMDQATYILRPNTTAYRLALERAKEIKGQGQRPMIVMLLVVDSYSRKHFYRKMPLTVQYLNSLNKASGSYRVFDFKLHNIIGGNSVANQMPILTERGVKVNDFRPNQDFARNQSMWSEFRTHGFVTYFGFEDCDDSFPRKIGRMPEIDHTTNPFYCAVFKFTDCRMSKSSQKQRCIGSHMSHDYLLNYTKQFTAAYPQAHQWLYLHLSAAHEASGLHAETLDEDLRDYLKHYLEALGDKEVVILLEADHGMRYGDWYKSVEAFQENRLPVFFVIAGRRLLDRIPGSYDTLKHNSYRLNSKLDMRRTLLYLAKVPSDEPDSPQPPDAVNLFTEKARDNRTCEELHIPAWHCACLELQRVSAPSDSEFSAMVRYLAEYAITSFNEEVYSPRDMRRGSLCRKLHLASVESTYGVRLSAMTEELKLELSVRESPAFRIEVTFLLTSSHKKVPKDATGPEELLLYNGYRKRARILSVMRLDRYVGSCEAKARAAELNPEVCICSDTVN